MAESVLLVLPQVITSQEARDTQRMLMQALQQAAKGSAETTVSVDASGLQRFDSAALAVLLDCQRSALAHGKQFAVRHAPPKLVELAHLYGIDGLLTLSDQAPVSTSH
ncbi:MAG: hypothetical protein RLZZ618_1869 [Pseudomonadota bacterium]